MRSDVPLLHTNTKVFMHFLKIHLVIVFSSMVPGSRNPMWGEEFNFSVDDLPVQVVALHPYLCD